MPILQNPWEDNVSLDGGMFNGNAKAKQRLAANLNATGKIFVCQTEIVVFGFSLVCVKILENARNINKLARSVRIFNVVKAGKGYSRLAVLRTGIVSKHLGHRT